MTPEGIDRGSISGYAVGDVGPLNKVFVAGLVLLAALGSVRVAGQSAPLRIYLRGGPKTHGPAGNGQHDGPTWVKEWQPLLTSRGAKVDGSLQFPTAEQLDNTDVLVMFAANAGNIAGEQRASRLTKLHTLGEVLLTY